MQTLPVQSHIKLFPIISFDTVIDLSEGQPRIRRGPCQGPCTWHSSYSNSYIEEALFQVFAALHLAEKVWRMTFIVQRSYHAALVEGLLPLLKGQCHKIFCFRFHHESSSPQPLKLTLGHLNFATICTMSHPL
jgi:hypothetical protein